MPWQMLWPDFLKKRLCRYLLQHYLGNFFKEKISLEQLSIDIYNGTGIVKNLNLDCDALNEQLNAAASSNSSSCSSSSSSSAVPIEIVSGFVGYISVYIPWHDLFNDYCKLTIKNVQITIRTKQRKHTNSSGSAGGSAQFRRKSSSASRGSLDETIEESASYFDFDDNESTDSNSNSMFSSMFVDSLMNTSMHIAQECLSGNRSSHQNNSYMEETNTATNSDDESSSLRNEANNKTGGNSLLGLEAFASTIDSILSRIKINLEQIQIRIENLDTMSSAKLSESNIMNSSTLFSNRPSNGIALELRIKSIKYFDIDSANNDQQQASSKSTDNSNTTNTNTTTSNLRNTTKSFNIEGLTIYFDEFIVKDDSDLNTGEAACFSSMRHETNVNKTEQETELSKSLNSTIELSSSSADQSLNDSKSQHQPVPVPPQDESQPFTYDLNPDYYLYTNPIIFITFSGIQSIKLTINNMRPTDLIMEATSSSTAHAGKQQPGSNTAGTIDPTDKLQLQQQRPFLEMNAQFGSIKCLMSPKQLHLLIDMFTRLNDYIEAANATRKAFKHSHHRLTGGLLRPGQSSKQRAKMSSVRGCDKRKFEALIQNDLIYNSASNHTDYTDEDEYEKATGNNMQQFKTIDNETSVMFYSMMSESSAFNNNNNNNMNMPPVYLNLSSNSPDSSSADFKENIANEHSTNETDADTLEDRHTQAVSRELKQTIEQLQTDVIMASNTQQQHHASAKTNQHNLFQTFKVTFRMFSLTVLHHDPMVISNGTSGCGGNERLLVDRMKILSDSYFDWVATIDATTSSSSASASSSTNSNSHTVTSIDKNTITKYHQACAFNDHFLVLFKPINMNLVQKINQRYLNTTASNSKQQQRQSQIIQYSLNELSLSVGYIQIDEYLVAAPSTSSSQNTKTKPTNLTNLKRLKVNQIIEACHQATIIEIIHFTDSMSSGLIDQQPCLKVQLVFYEPIEHLVNSTGKNKPSKQPHSGSSFSASSSSNMQAHLLSNHFENISIQLNQSLVCELDISMIDRLYYLINSPSNSTSAYRKSPASSAAIKQPDLSSSTKMTRNLEIKSSQVIKVALRFPIADLRRTQQPSSSLSSASKSTQPKATASADPDPTTPISQATPITLIAFRQLREQILTLHLFELTFQTLLASSVTNSSNTNIGHSTTTATAGDCLSLTLTSSQINAYYQYTKKDRPIHFGLIQQRPNEPRSLICSIKIPASVDGTGEVVGSGDSQQLGSVNEPSAGSFYNIMTETNADSLQTNYNISVSKANRFHLAQTIKEENENLRDDLTEKEDNEEDCNSSYRCSNKKSDINDDPNEEDEDENDYSPFSRIHSLISSEKNRRIVNAGNKTEMQSFIQQSRARSQTTIKFTLPQLKFLIADQKFLNDIYNCILNDLIMWVPSPVAPIETAMLNNNAGNNSFLPSLNFLVDYNYENEFIATRMQGTGEFEESKQQQQFHMCRSAILKPSLSSKSDSEKSDYCESDDDQSKRKYQQQYEDFSAHRHFNKSAHHQQKLQNLKSTKQNTKHTLSVVLAVEVAHLKAFVLNTEKQQTSLKYGEFDIKATNYQMCIAISESLKLENSSSDNSKNKKQAKKTATALASVPYKIEKQQICIFTDQINISHSTKTCPNNVQQLKYPTNYSSFESLFQMSKTKDLITLNEPGVCKSLFTSQSDSGSQSSLITVPMVSIGIKSKFNTKKNTKQLLVALNFNNLTLHHLFCAQTDFWIFQLIMLFDLIDIEIVGYEAPIVLTELHLNVANSCIVYKPVYLSTQSLIAFKSLHWSSNVTAESSLTLLVFNIEDIYLFLSKHKSDESSTIDLKRDYICVANSDLFELRLLISDEEMNQKKTAAANSTSAAHPPLLSTVAFRKYPLLDIKIRSNLIQLRTCVDSAFTLIELINYIVSDGDLHQPNLIMSEFMSSNASNLGNQPATVANNLLNTNNPLSSIPLQSIDSTIQQQQLSTADTSTTLDSLGMGAVVVGDSLHPSNTNISKAINIASTTVSSSIPIQRKQSAVFTVGTPPSSSFKSSSSSFSQQIFYSPLKSNNSGNSSQNGMSPGIEHVQFASNSSAKSQPITVPLPTPSLSFVNFKTTSGNSVQSTNMASASAASSAESLISDMVKEAMHSNPMTQSVYGSLSSAPFSSGGNEKKDQIMANIGTRKRNPSLTLLSPDLQTKRLISHSFMLNTNSELSKLNTLKESSNLSSLRNSDDDESDESDDDIKLRKDSFIKDHYQTRDTDDEDESLIASIHFNHKKSLINTQKKQNHDSETESDDGNYSENTMNKSNDDDDDSEQNEDFHFDLPFSNISPMVQKNNENNNKNKHTESTTAAAVNRQLMFDKNNRRLHFKPATSGSDDETENYASKNINRNDDEDDDAAENADEELLRDFDIIDVIPGFGEPPCNNQEFEIKVLRRKSLNPSQVVMIKEDHFKKPLTKIDVLKAPESYPCPLNVYCIQEISINWCLYGGSDFTINTSETTYSEPVSSVPPQPAPPATTSSGHELPTNKMNRTVSSPIIVTGGGSVSPSSQMIFRSRNNSTSSNSLSMSPQLSYQSPPGQPAGSSPSNPNVKFNPKTASVNFSKEKYLPRKAGGRIIHKYDTNSLNWMARGGKLRNLDVCMEIALYKVKTKIDMYSDLNDSDELDNNKENQLLSKNNQPSKIDSPYLYRVALAIGDIEIRDKLASSPFNMFLFRYESEHCPKHTNSNMLFVKFLCSKSMDAQRLIECDIKVSIQPLRFNIDQDALIFLVEFFTKLASKDLNEFSKTLVPPPSPQPVLLVNESNENFDTQSNAEQPLPAPQPQTPQQIFIRNFIFSPDLLVRFDFSGKYDSRSDTKMDTLTKLLLVAIQLSNTEIKLKRICYKRGFLGAEKLLTALLKEWIHDIQRNQMKNLIKGWGIFNSLIQFFEGFTYLIWYPIEQYRKDGRVLCGIQKGSAAFSTCTVLATIELTNRMFQATKNIAEFFYDLVTPHRANSHHHHNFNMLCYGSNTGLVDTILTGVGNNRNIRVRRHPNDIREGLTNAYYVMYEGINDTAANLIQEINQGAEHKGIPGAIGGALRQLPSTALAPIVLTTEATCNILSGIRNQLKPDEKRDDDQKWKTIAFNS